MKLLQALSEGFGEFLPLTFAGDGIATMERPYLRRETLGLVTSVCLADGGAQAVR